MKRLIQYALTQPLFVVMGTLLFAAAGLERDAPRPLADRLRFDFSHPTALTAEDIAAIEAEVLPRAGGVVIVPVVVEIFVNAPVDGTVAPIGLLSIVLFVICSPD